MRKGSFLHLRLVWRKPAVQPSMQRQSSTSSRTSALGKGFCAYVTFVHYGFHYPVRTGTLGWGAVWLSFDIRVIWYNSELAKSSTTSPSYMCEHVMFFLWSSTQEDRRLHILETGFFSFCLWGLVCFRGSGNIKNFMSTDAYLWLYVLPSSWIFIIFPPSCFSRENDVAGIDVNMGCPKEYSTKVNWFCYTLHKYRVQIKGDWQEVMTKYSTWVWTRSCTNGQNAQKDIIRSTGKIGI